MLLTIQDQSIPINLESNLVNTSSNTNQLPTLMSFTSTSPYIHIHVHIHINIYIHFLIHLLPYTSISSYIHIPIHVPIHVPIMSMDNGKMHILPVHVCSHNVIFDSPKYHKILGDLTFWRKPGNLDKKRTRTYLWGRYSSQGQRYRTAAFGFTPCPILSCPWRMDGGPLVLMAIDLVDA